MEAFLNSVASELVNAVLVMVIAALTTWIKFAFDKWDLEKFGLKREQAITVMRGLVLSQEERVEALFKKGVIQYADKGDAKLEAVLSAFMQKFPKFTREEAEELAHEAVATTGVGAADFLAKLLKASQA